MEDAGFGAVVVGIASAGDGWVVAAASAWVAGSAVAAVLEVAERVGVACASREVVELGVAVAAAVGFAIDAVDEDCVAVGEFVAVAAG